jgi:hypothetical protein
MTKVEKIARKVIADHPFEIQDLSNELAFNTATPAQRQINAMFRSIGVDRFPSPGHDVWEMITAIQNAWEYKAPGRTLCERWERY